MTTARKLLSAKLAPDALIPTSAESQPRFSTCQIFNVYRALRSYESARSPQRSDTVRKVPQPAMNSRVDDIREPCGGEARFSG
jgi:hypothetical protein